MLKLKNIVIKGSVFGTFSLLGLTAWIVIGALNEEAQVAGGSWFELALGLAVIWGIASNVSEMVVGNSSLHNFVDMVTIAVAIVIVLVVGKFSISFESVTVAVKSMKWPLLVTAVLALFIAVSTELIAGLISKKTGD